jgi:hypothetical protein
MGDTRRFGSFSSSADPSKLAAKVQGVILAASTIIIWGAFKLFGIELEAKDINDLAIAAGGLTSAFLVIYGTVRNIAVFAIDKWNNRIRG